MEENGNMFWVRGIGLSTYKSKFSRDTFTLDELWDLAKHVENCKDNKIIEGCFLSQYEIPFFTDQWVNNVDRSFKTVCAMCGENRLRILISPYEDTEGGKQLMWCRENNIPLYCFATGRTPRREGGKVFLHNFNIVLNKSSCSFTIADDRNSVEEGVYCERDVLVTYPVPEEFSFKTCKIGVWSDSDDSAVEMSRNFFFSSNYFFKDRDRVISYKEIV